MRALRVFGRLVREQVRDLLSLSLVVMTASLFIVLYWSFTAGGSTTYTVLVLDQDHAAASRGVVEAMRAIQYPDGQAMLKVTEVSDRGAAEDKLRNREAAVLVILPPDLTAGLGTDHPPKVTFVGDLTNPMYAVASVLSHAGLQAISADAAAYRAPYEFEEQALGGSGSRTEFEAYVPGILVISVLTIIFTVAMAVAREVEAGTLRRLKLTRMTALDYLAGVTVSQTLLAIASLLAAIGLATALGFRSVGPLWAAIVVASLTALSVVGAGLIVACYSNTMTRAFLLANLPFVIMMFFSGAVFPLPKTAIFHLGDHPVGMWDFLPSTHAVVAFNKILSLGVGLGDVTWELGWLVTLSVLFFAIGVVLFHRRHLRPAA